MLAWYSGSWDTPGQFWSLGVPSTWNILYSSSISCGKQWVMRIGEEMCGHNEMRHHPATLSARASYRVPRKQRLVVDHLCKDAADAPEVHRCGVVLSAQQDFRGPIPEGDDLHRGLAAGEQLVNRCH